MNFRGNSAALRMEANLIDQIRVANNARIKGREDLIANEGRGIPRRRVGGFSTSLDQPQRPLGFRWRSPGSSPETGSDSESLAGVASFSWR